MNQNPVNGTVNNRIGRMQEATEKASGSKKQQTEEVLKQVFGNAEIAIGEATKDVRIATISAKNPATRRCT